MHEGIVIGGLGGQGVLFIGRLLAEAAMLESREVVWLPSYGAEKRGGSVWCHVTISDERIGELFVTRPTAAIAMNPASLTKLEPMMKPGGLLVINQSLVSSRVKRDDLDTVYVPAINMATELGDDSVANLVALGALVGSRPIVTMPSLVTAMDSMLSKSPKLETNKRALDKGYSMFRMERSGRDLDLSEARNDVVSKT